MLSRNSKRKCIARVHALFPVDWLDSLMAAEDDARFRTPSMPQKKHCVIRLWVSLLKPKEEPKDDDDREPVQEPVKVKTAYVEAPDDEMNSRWQCQDYPSTAGDARCRWCVGWARTEARWDRFV